MICKFWREIRGCRLGLCAWDASPVPNAMRKVKISRHDCGACDPSDCLCYQPKSIAPSEEAGK